MTAPARPRWWRAGSVAWLRANWLVLPMLLLVVGQGVFDAVRVPLWQGPDEPTHYEYVRVLAEGLPPEPNDRIEAEILTSMRQFNWWYYVGAPLADPPPRRFQDEPAFGGDAFWQVGRQPPLYYAIGAALLNLRTGQRDAGADQLRLRLYSVALLGLGAMGAYVAGLALFGRPGWAAALGLLTAGLPMVAYLGSSVNNDALAIAVGAWSFVPAVRILRGSFGWPTVGFAALLLVLAALTKWTALAAVGGGIGLAFAFAVWPRLGGRLRPALVASSLVALIAVWSVVRGADDVAGWRFEPRTPVGHQTDLAWSGLSALWLHAAAGSNEHAIQRVPIDAVVRLRGAWVELSLVVAGDPGGQALVRIEDGVTATERAIAVGPQWQAIALFHQVDPHASQVAVRLIAISPGTPADVRFDAVRLVPGAPGESTPNLLSNGGFEQRRPTLRRPLFDRLYASDQSAKIVDYLLDPVHWSGSALADDWYLLGSLHFTFWGSYGYGAAAIPTGWLTVLLGLELVGLAGLVVVQRTRAPDPAITPQFGIWLIGVLAGCVALTIVRAFPPDPFGAGIGQGRYLFPIAAPIGAGLLVGWSALLPVRLRRWLPAIAATGLGGFVIASLAFVVLPFVQR